MELMADGFDSRKVNVAVVEGAWVDISLGSQRTLQTASGAARSLLMSISISLGSDSFWTSMMQVALPRLPFHRHGLWRSLVARLTGGQARPIPTGPNQ